MWERERERNAELTERGKGEGAEDGLVDKYSFSK
jgi:hypothetical protein